MQLEALRKYRELIEQGLAPSEAKDHVKRIYDITISDTWAALALRGDTW